MDHRLVIIPNSVLSTNQVVNYTYPGPRYRIQTNVGVAYGTDIKRARQVMIDAVRQVGDVLLDKPVDALYIARQSTPPNGSRLVACDILSACAFSASSIECSP